MGSFLPEAFCLLIFLISLGSTCGPFFELLDMLFFHPTIFDNRFFWVLAHFPSLFTQSLFTPRTLRRLHANTRATFSTPVRVRAWVLSNSTDGRPEAHVAFTTGFAQLNVFPFLVADFTDGGVAIKRYFSDLAGRKFDCCLVVFALDDSWGTGWSNQLGAFAWI